MHWIPYTKELCRTCWANCCHDMPVEVSVPDLIRLGYLNSEQAATELTAVTRQLLKDGILKRFRPGSLVFVLAQQTNKDCIFLGPDRRCTVYDKRPEICRQFPKIGPKPGHCPYEAK